MDRALLVLTGAALGVLLLELDQAEHAPTAVALALAFVAAVTGGKPFL